MQSIRSNHPWQANTAARTISGAVRELAYRAASEADRSAGRADLARLESPLALAPNSIGNLTRAADAIRAAIGNHTPISVFGDYDADGVTASAILYLMLRQLGAVISGVRLPRRMSEGYGIKAESVQELISANPHGLLILVDNGITALEPVRLARESGLTVIVLDHHLPMDTGELPEAHILVDQHVPSLAGSTAQPSYFEDYCGAGLAYRLACLLLSGSTIPGAEACLTQCVALAAIGTVCDMVPLYDDNRVIVREGLDALKERRVTPGLALLAERLLRPPVNEQSFAFHLGPAINACGRLYDDDARNARLPFRLLAANVSSDSGRQQLRTMAEEIVRINYERRSAVEDAVRRLSPMLVDDPGLPILLFDESGFTHEGVVGIVAGKFASEYGRSAYVFTKGENGLYKGSARIAGEDHIREKLDRVHALHPDIFRSYGGHTEAAGVAITVEGREAFREALYAAYRGAGYHGFDVSAVSYDVLLRPQEVPAAYQELQRYAPYGTGCPEPAVCVTGCSVTDVRYLGGEGQHVRLSTPDGFQVIAFQQAAAYQAMGEPDTVDVVGHLSVNSFQGNDTLQLTASAIRRAEPMEG